MEGRKKAGNILFNPNFEKDRTRRKLTIVPITNWGDLKKNGMAKSERKSTPNCSLSFSINSLNIFSFFISSIFHNTTKRENQSTVFFEHK